MENGKKGKRRRRDSEEAVKAAPPEQDDSVSDVDSSGDESESEEDLDLNAEAGSEMIDADVGFFDPAEADVGHVEQLLLSSGQDAYGPTEVRKFAEAICAQTRVGTVVRVDGEPDSIAFITCLSFETHRELLTPLRKHVFRSARGDDVQALRKYLPKEGSHAKLGLLVCERVVNFPPQLIPKLQEAVFDEIQWAQEDEPTEELRASFKFEAYLYITDVLMSSAGTSAKKKKKKRPKKKKKDYDAQKDQFEFFRPEDDAINTHSIAKNLTFTSKGQAPLRGGLIKRRIALLFPAASVGQMREAVTELIERGDENAT